MFDCEAEVKLICPDGADIDTIGNCITEENPVNCRLQCQEAHEDGDGVLITGTGMCQCDHIFDTDEICNQACQDTAPRAVLNAEGLMVVTDPVTSVSSTFDPTNSPGTFGNFKPRSETGSTESNIYFMGNSEGGSFTYDY